MSHHSLLLVPVIMLMFAVLGKPALGEVALPAVFGDHMVLQRGVRIPIWGSGQPGAAVTVTLDTQRAVATVDRSGKWQVTLGPLPAGGPYTLTVQSGGQSLSVRDILLGEVWLCSGQSNMQFGLSSAKNAREAIAQADRPRLRLSNGAHWDVCTPESAAHFSAVAYFFGSALQQHLQVPVGLIANALGGSPVEAWISPETFARERDLHEQVEKPWQQYLHAWQAAPEGKKPYPALGPDYINAPSRLFEQRIRPLVPFALRGVLWYQGESNAWGFHAAQMYARELPALIGDWRRQWDEDFPFILVQLPSYDAVPSLAPKEPAPWNVIQEIQAQTARQVAKTGLVVITELGEHDIHPLNKQPVGERAALAARKLAYGEEIECRGPELASCAITGNSVRLHFTHTGGGLTTLDGREPQGFTLAGEDRRQYWAHAVIDGDDLILTCAQVAHPLSARYDYSEDSSHNLGNKIGLSASPFRSDDWSWDLPARRPRLAQCRYTDQPPLLDGTLHDPLWSRCPAETDFTLPYSYCPSAYPTEVRFAYDAEHLYVAFRCLETEMTTLRARAVAANEEKIWSDDAVELLLDVRHDRRTYYHLVINPSGSVLAGKGFNNHVDGPRLVNQNVIGDWRGFDLSWDSRCLVHTAREAHAWTVELSLPWASLGLPCPTPGSKCGLQLLRYHADPAEHSEWITTGRDYNTGAMMPGTRQIQSPFRFGELEFGRER